MKYTRLLPLIVMSLLMTVLSPASAQDDDKCEIDMTEVINLTDLAQEQADEGDRLGALDTVAQLQAQLDALFTACTQGDSGAADVSGIELTQTISVVDAFTNGRVTLSYPADWSANNDFGLIILANTAAAIDADIPFGLQSGEIQITTLVLEATWATILGVELTDTPEDFLVAMRALEDDPALNQTYDDGEITSFDANGRAAAMTFGTVTAPESGYALGFAIVDAGDVFVLLQIFGAETDDLNDYAPIIRAIMASVEYEGSES